MTLSFYCRDRVKDDKYELQGISHVKNDLIPFDVIQYDETCYNEDNLKSLSEFDILLTTITHSNTNNCKWIKINGIDQKDVINKLSMRFKIHELIKEDITTNQRMKLDILNNGSTIYLLMKMIYINPYTNNIQREQISFLLQENNILITIQEVKSRINRFDVFQVVKHRLQNNRGRIRSLKIDYLFYCLMDVIIENYMQVLDHIRIKIDNLDRLLMKKLKQTSHNEALSNYFNVETLKLIYRLKHDMLSFKILCQPLREIIIKLQKAQDRISMVNRVVQYRRQYRRKKRPKRIVLSGNYFFNPNIEHVPRRFSLAYQGKDPLFNEYIYIYFKDLDDQIVQLHDRIDSYCDLLSSLVTFYIIISDTEINRIMTCLTLISIIFIPLTFLTSLFSMNFRNMPPLRWDYGHYCVLIIVATFIVCVLTFFKYKRWL